MNMADIEARPSKIRKLDLSEGAERSQGSSSALLDLDEKNNLDLDVKNNLEESAAQAEAETNGTSHHENQVVEDGKPPLSKNQLKKLRRQEKWEAGKEYRKMKRREKHKEKQARKAATAQEADTGGAEVPEISPAKDNKQHPRRPIQVPLTLIVDCDFNELMTEKELISLGAQLTRCYSDNKSSPYRYHMVMSSWGGPLKTRFETVLANHHLNWKGVRFLETDFQAAAEELDAVMRSPEGGKLVGALSKGEGRSLEDKVEVSSTEKSRPCKSSLTAPESQEKPASEKDEPASLDKETEQSAGEIAASETTATNHSPSIIYLTSDSPNTLEKLSPNTSYIIGGIVDKNRHKGICYKRACERGIPTAKLPIGEYMTMQSRAVLAVNHVVEIMLQWLQTGDWGEAFLRVIPKRKEAKLKADKNANAGGSEVVVEGEDIEGEDEDRDEEPNHEGIAA